MKGTHPSPPRVTQIYLWGWGRGNLSCLLEPGQLFAQLQLRVRLVAFWLWACVLSHSKHGTQLAIAWGLGGSAKSDACYTLGQKLELGLDRFSEVPKGG